MAEGITSAITSVMSIMTTVATTITENPVLALFLGASLVGVGVGIFRKLKG